MSGTPRPTPPAAWRSQPGDDHAIRTEDLALRLKRIALIAKVTDTMIPIPGTDVKIGLDAVVGCVPVVGDLAMACASALLIHDAHKLGLPRPALLAMIRNAALDAAIGAVPFVGDLFDLVFRANERNLRILEVHVGRLDAPTIDAQARERQHG